MHGEVRALGGIAHVHGARHGGDDFVTDGEAQPRALAGILGREERVEEVVDVRLVDAAAVVRDGNGNFVVFAG